MPATGRCVTRRIALKSTFRQRAIIAMLLLASGTKRVVSLINLGCLIPSAARLLHAKGPLTAPQVAPWQSTLGVLTHRLGVLDSLQLS
ncbi:hypothetical protein B0H10DRAFT_2021137 [Mycena sp. CBHHK59/15]|nr:hypothetical protein B0H10DRAFT_2021137 [Mycena sp. CBHHK59/15]